MLNTVPTNLLKTNGDFQNLLLNTLPIQNSPTLILFLIENEHVCAISCMIYSLYWVIQSKCISTFIDNCDIIWSDRTCLKSRGVTNLKVRPHSTYMIFPLLQFLMNWINRHIYIQYKHNNITKFQDITHM